MEENLKPLPINELLDKQFFIPHYQRGYRWTNQQVEQFNQEPKEFKHHLVLHTLIKKERALSRKFAYISLP